MRLQGSCGGIPYVVELTSHYKQNGPETLISRFEASQRVGSSVPETSRKGSCDQGKNNECHVADT